MVSGKKTFFNLVSTPREIQLFYEHTKFERKMFVSVRVSLRVFGCGSVCYQNAEKIKRLTIDRNRPQNIWFLNRFLCTLHNENVFE